MAGLSLSAADAVILSVVIAVVALIVRGMLQGRIKSCDCGSCAGNCGSCGHVCSTPRIRLTDQQLAELRELEEKAREA